MFRKCFGDTNKILCFLTEIISVLPAVRLSFFLLLLFFFSVSCYSSSKQGWGGAAACSHCPIPREVFFMCLGTCWARPKSALPATPPAPVSLGAAGSSLVEPLGRASALREQCCLPGKSLLFVSSLPWLFSAPHLLASHLPPLSRVLAFKWVSGFVRAC